ncbi:MAG: EAL domain-containing protein, partial [Coriobacteriales bacterium]|nr:EAL domain-containing protein [Coriobacteriales bacterium]
VGLFYMEGMPPERVEEARVAADFLVNYLSTMIIVRDLSQRLRAIGLSDRVTGAGTRNALFELVPRIEKDKSMGVLCVDIIGMSEVNEARGWSAGDELLRMVYGCLADVFGGTCVYRIGGDDFLVAYPGVREKRFASLVALVRERLRKMDVVVAIGVAWKSEVDDSFDVLLRKADLALLEEKSDLRRTGKVATEPLVKQAHVRKYDELFEMRPASDTYKLLSSSLHLLSAFPPEGCLSEYLVQLSRLFVHPQDREIFMGFWNPDTLMDRLQADPQGVTVQYRYHIPGGDWGMVEERAVYVADSDEGPVIHDFIHDLGVVELPGENFNTLANAHLNLPHQDEFYGQANAWLERNKGLRFAVVALDVNFFKLYNDIYGRDAGDKLLEFLAGILSTLAEKGGGVAGYLGGDNFSLLVPCPAGMDDEGMKNLIMDGMHNLDSFEGFMPACGVCITDNADLDISVLYDRALVALGTVKGSYSQHVAFYDEDKYKEIRENQLLLIDAQKGLKNDEFTFYLQPKVDLRTGRIISAEALVRWIHDGAVVPPIRFIPSMEQNGYVFALDRVIWDKVCAWQRSLIDRGIEPLPVSVNVSRVDFYFTDIAEYFVDLLDKYRLDARYVSVEITESAYSKETELVNRVIDKLQRHGFVVLMDDFGTGYSSLNMLRTTPVDVLKLDKSFLDNGTARKGAEAIIGSVIDMAHTLSLPVITEGVETAEQRDHLASLGCDIVQGYYYYRPMPIEQYEELLTNPQLVLHDHMAFRKGGSSA